MIAASAWRLILDEPQSGGVNMAVDAALVTSVESGSSSTPVLRIYGWSEPTVSIGRYQDAAALEGRGLPVVRRVTGGRAVIHAAELTYSIVSPSEHPLFREGIIGAYRVISNCIIGALGKAGVKADLAAAVKKTTPGEKAKAACFYSPSRYEVTVGNRKLVGSAQRRFRTAFLQHGSILFTVDRGLHEAVFGQQAASELMDRMTGLSEHADIDITDFSNTLVRGFESGLCAEFTPSRLSEAEEYIKTGLLAGGDGVAVDAA
ncbi:MAG: lipoate--protein ligase family protein [Deltaproteobacteria bacterium]|nr:lipoate--protein ligase family protein [Deltaproteobacteria bacterium]